MKNSVIILGIALVSFSNICNAKNTVNFQCNLFQNINLSADTTAILNNELVKFEKPSLAEDVKIFDPQTVIAYNPKTIKEIIIEGDKIVENTVSDDLEFMEYEQSMREIITQSDLITENTIPEVIYPLYNEKTLFDEISEMELVIESNVTDEAKLLDFKKINSNSIMIKSINTEKNIGMN